MARLYLIRHARPSASWGEEPDPALDAIGRKQAEAAAQGLSQTLECMPIYTSPLRRCRETAHPLEQLWQRKANVLEPVAEIPSPPVDRRMRQQWLKEAMLGTWQDLNRSAPLGSPDYLAWRRALLDALARMSGDAVIFTHFIAINVVVGTAQSRDDVVCFRPDHASVTCVEMANESVRLLELGRQRDTTVIARG
jgi:broad specificity phosphatase PhoE